MDLLGSIFFDIIGIITFFCFKKVELYFGL